MSWNWFSQTKITALKPTGDPLIFMCFNYLNSGFYCLSNNIIVGRMWPWPLAAVVPHALTWGVPLFTCWQQGCERAGPASAWGAAPCWRHLLIGSETLWVAHSKRRQHPLSLWNDKVPFAQGRVRVLAQNAETGHASGRVADRWLLKSGVESHLVLCHQCEEDIIPCCFGPKQLSKSTKEV